MSREQEMYEAVGVPLVMEMGYQPTRQGHILMALHALDVASKVTTEDGVLLWDDAMAYHQGLWIDPPSVDPITPDQVEECRAQMRALMQGDTEQTVEDPECTARQMLVALICASDAQGYDIRDEVSEAL